MPFNQFSAVRITDDQTALHISGESETADVKDVDAIHVAIARLPPGTDPVEVLSQAEFDHAAPLTDLQLVDDWTAIYEMPEPGQYAENDMVIVVGSAVSQTATDIWADTFDIKTMDEDRRQPR